jgi:hypothetical protein
MAADGHVTFDPVSRSVFVKPAKHAGYAGLLWRRGHQAMMEDAGRYGAPAVWAHFTGCREIARCVPERDGWCRFQSRHNDPVYRQLSQMGHLAAVVTVDRQAPRVSREFRSICTTQATSLWRSFRLESCRDHCWVGVR